MHIAPGFGEDDYQLGCREGLPTVCPIDEDCRFTNEVGDYLGEFVKDVDTSIIRHLRNTNQLFSGWLNDKKKCTVTTPERRLLKLS